MIASHADVLRGSSRVPAPRKWLFISADKSYHRRINEIFITSIFQDHMYLINIHEKNGNSEASPDNRKSPDNRGSTVIFKVSREQVKNFEGPIGVVPCKSS